MINQKEKEIFEYIKQSMEKGIVPTVREIRDNLGYSSTATVNKYINSLCEKGYIEKSSNQKRNMRLIGYESIPVPVVSSEKYTESFMDVESILGYISWTPDKEHDYPLFAVKSDVSYNSVINDGDIVIAEKTVSSGADLYIETCDGSLRFTNIHNPKCIGRIVSFIRYF